jgi:hypothetical protein
VTPNGVAIAHTEARFGRGGDWDAIDIVMRRSLDNGLTWEDQRVMGRSRNGPTGWPEHWAKPMAATRNALTGAIAAVVICGRTAFIPVL